MAAATFLDQLVDHVRAMLLEYVEQSNELAVQPRFFNSITTNCTTSAQCGWDYLCDTARGVCYPPRDCLAAIARRVVCCREQGRRIGNWLQQFGVDDEQKPR